MRVLAEFSTRWTTCWVTTYTFEPAFFDTVLARRLGDPPLNIVALADQDRLARTWQSIGPAERWSLRGANRKYLVRGVTLPAGVFHPKTILLANEKEGVLLVGSGNVGFNGLDQGREVYARFGSGSSDDKSAFAAWREWMGEVVAFVDEPVLRSRWGTLLTQLRWLPSDTTGSAVVTNWHRPILEQFLDAGHQSADELAFASPFFDSHLAALSDLIHETNPTKITGYFGSPTSVDGTRLAALLQAAGHHYDMLAVNPPEFVHAKVFATFNGDTATVLTGSPNASRPALLTTAFGGNAEVGVISHMSANDAQGLFAPPGSSHFPLTVDDMRSLQVAADSEASLPPIRLIAATLGHDGRITITSRPAPESARLAAGERQLSISDNTTNESLGDHKPDLVWLEDLNGERISNSVPVDIRTELDAALQAHDPGPDRPRDLDALDLQHPLGRLLLGLHRSALFDIDDTPAARHAQPGERDETEVDDRFWERLLHEELDADPRTAGYRKRLSTHVFVDDELTWLLEEMLHRAPSPTVLRLIDRSELDQASTESSGKAWAPERKFALRAYNVLVRWALALNDSRVEWFAETAQIRHYAALLGVLAEIWPKGWIAHERLRTILGLLFEAFVLGERSTGYLGAKRESERARPLEALTRDGCT